MHTFRRLVLILVAVAILGIGGALALSLKTGEQLQYEQEWVKALLQAGLIAVLGVVTSGVLEVIKDAIQQRRDDSKLRFNALAELGRVYMDVKLVRRAAQATGVLAPDQLTELNQRQVLLELLVANSNQFPSGASLEEHLTAMEKYLNHVANDANSDERKTFLDDGFKLFSKRYKESASLMRADIAAKRVVPTSSD